MRDNILLITTVVIVLVLVHPIPSPPPCIRCVNCWLTPGWWLALHNGGNEDWWQPHTMSRYQGRDYNVTSEKYDDRVTRLAL